ncbi:hypothetical protein Taro_000927 [Colocasia esculenta]|uniref:Protein kinase domain-containing protein n=1 Tax=Colocasia esculenta TaxID=4460 RepID=A0A843TGD9_COLES|nr:hypothetical protein [Colocasia esculenta]
MQFSNLTPEEFEPGYLRLHRRLSPMFSKKAVGDVNGEMAQHLKRLGKKDPMTKIFRALAYIHGTLGVCHRDIKPQNVLLHVSESAGIFYLSFSGT